MNSEMFFKQNSIRKENIFFAPSDRFIENGEKINWEIRPISAKEDCFLRESCMKNVYDSNEKRYKAQFDSRKYMAKLCAASTVFPDLKDVSLQESYGVMGEEDLLLTMLTSGEYERYAKAVQKANGYILDFEELKKEAKN
jgi:hypothetical protein